MMMTGKYVRPSPKELVGETALLMWRSRCRTVVLAQFNSLEKFSRVEHDWAFGWHPFPADSFEITERDHED